MKQVKLAILGLGNVPLAFIRYLQEDAPKRALSSTGIELLVTGVTTGSRGNAIDRKGIPFDAILGIGKKGDVSALNKGPVTKNNLDFIAQVPADILLVSTPASIPSVDEIRAAFGRGMSVVTSNKTPVAYHYAELMKEAKEHGVQFRFGATVLAGYPPWYHWFESISRQEITEMQIVVNATANQILTMMFEEGKSFEEGVRKAQELGIAEHNPSDDVDGYDTQKKLVILANVLMDAGLTPSDVPVTGIRNITVEELRKADEAKRWIHLMGWAHKLANGKVRAEVRSTVTHNPFFAGMRGTAMGLYFRTPTESFSIRLDLGEGDQAITATAKGVFEDILTIAKSRSQ